MRTAPIQVIPQEQTDSEEEDSSRDIVAMIEVHFPITDRRKAKRFLNKAAELLKEIDLGGILDVSIEVGPVYGKRDFYTYAIFRVVLEIYAKQPTNEDLFDEAVRRVRELKRVFFDPAHGFAFANLIALNL